ncbi:hypothetical protein GCM10011506_00720 [Marivirga lumbricoides]|uniref:Uncharacterized protein n=1 Tax=Marivirga lumbricoides TaxID=1046115 RepID=A0ABQ1L4L2_9BACT|nr:hypothetical protein GCM10011506_00720 [Marivirga lumbricoides]
MKIILYLQILLLLIGCKVDSSQKTKIIDTGKFEIELPVDWNYETIQGDDSFLGKLTGPNMALFFDWSEFGYAGFSINNDSTINFEEIELPHIGSQGIIDNHNNQLQSKSVKKLKHKKEYTRYQLKVDTVDNYIRTYIQPKKGKDGLTAVLIEDLNSSFNFNIIGERVKSENQDVLIKSFKSIKIKRE